MAFYHYWNQEEGSVSKYTKESSFWKVTFWSSKSCSVNFTFATQGFECIRYLLNTSEVCAAKTHLLRSLSLSYQKKVLTDTCQYFFWYDTAYRFVICSLHRLYCIGGVILKEGLAEPWPPNSFFGMTTKRSLKMRFCSTWLKLGNHLTFTNVIIIVIKLIFFVIG